VRLRPAHYWRRRIGARELLAPSRCEPSATLAGLETAPRPALGRFSRWIAFLTTPFKYLGISGWEETGCEGKGDGRPVRDGQHSTDGFWTIDVELGSFAIGPETASAGRFVRLEIEPGTGAHQTCAGTPVREGMSLCFGGPIVVDRDGPFLEVHPDRDFEISDRGSSSTTIPPGSRVKIETQFPAADLAEVETAVREVEQTTSGEIVPVIVPESDAYPEAAWKGAVFGALLASLLAAALFELGDFWGETLFVWIAGPALAGGALGFLAARIPVVRRSLVSRRAIEHRVELRALAAFARHEVFRTRDRSGILLFLSLFERRVVVLGDSGIHARVAPSEWDAVASGIVAGIREGRAAKALAAGVRACGEILVRHALARRADDRDELPDRPSVEAP
jgi:putative membrane protein